MKNNDEKKGSSSAGDMSVLVSFCRVTAAPKLSGLKRHRLYLALDSVGWLGWVDGWNVFFFGLSWLDWGYTVQDGLARLSGSW